ncbi:hypothetical protein IJ531_01455 [bacterium]|nr:hypothetical protein [bacterium]
MMKNKAIVQYDTFYKGTYLKKGEIIEYDNNLPDFARIVPDEVNSQSEQLNLLDNLENKSEEELNKILDDLIIKGIEKNILLDDAQDLTTIEQIAKWQELLGE